MLVAIGTRAWPGDTSSVDRARKIDSDDELRAVAAAGTGFIIDPFNRWWHITTCPRILAMTTRQPKWHAATRDAREEFLQQRLARYPTAQPVLPCTACSDSAPRAPHPGLSRQAGTAGLQLRAPCVLHMGSSLEVWADDYVRNDSAAASPAGWLRRLIADGVRRLPEPAGRILHAGYGGQRRPGTDVENLLLNNIGGWLIPPFVGGWPGPWLVR